MSESRVQARCPLCGQPAPKTMPPLSPGCRLTVAERLVWGELARTPGYLVSLEQLGRHCANTPTLRVTIHRLRRKIAPRQIVSISSEGYVLERSEADRTIQQGWRR